MCCVCTWWVRRVCGRGGGAGGGEVRFFGVAEDRFFVVLGVCFVALCKQSICQAGAAG